MLAYLEQVANVESKRELPGRRNGRRGEAGDEAVVQAAQALPSSGGAHGLLNAAKDGGAVKEESRETREWTNSRVRTRISNYCARLLLPR